MAAPSLSAEKTCAMVQAALLGDTPRADDVCLLASGQGFLGPLARLDVPERLHPGNEALDRARDADETVP